MRVIETNARVGADGMLRLVLPMDCPNEDVRVAVVVESAVANQGLLNVDDPWAGSRAKLEASGIRVPPPGAWTERKVPILKVDGPPVSQTLVEDRR